MRALVRRQLDYAVTVKAAAFVHRLACGRKRGESGELFVCGAERMDPASE
jgi:hypothetical protein